MTFTCREHCKRTLVLFHPPPSKLTSKQQTPETLQAGATALSETSSRTWNLTYPTMLQAEPVSSFQAKQLLNTCCWKTYTPAASTWLGEGRCRCCLSCSTSGAVCRHQHLRVRVLGQSHHAPKSAVLTVQHQGPSSTTLFVIEPQRTLRLQQRQQYFSSCSLCPLGTS